MKVLGRMSIKQLILGDLEEIVLPGSILVDNKNDEWEAPQHPRFQINAKMETLISRSVDVSRMSVSTPRNANSVSHSSNHFVLVA